MLPIERWPRFQRYASLVRKATFIISSSSTGVESEVLIHPRVVVRALTLAHATGCPIIPANELILDPRDEIAAGDAIFLVHDNLRSIGLRWEYLDGSKLIPILKRITLCRGLTKISLDFKQRQSTQWSLLGHSLVEVIKVQPSLESVVIPSRLAFQPEVWNALRSLPVLKKLSGTGREHDFSVHDTSPFLRGFYFLRDAALSAPLEHILHLIMENPPYIQQLSLHVTDVVHSEAIHNLCQKIATAGPSLQYLSINLPGGTPALKITALLCLTHLRSLRTLKIVTANATLIDDRDIDLVVSHMPLLESLHISPTPTDDIHLIPNLTLLALSNIASHCRSMKHIALFIDASVARLPSHKHPLYSFSSSLETVDFGLSAVDKPEAVALRLIRMFQHPLPQISCHYPQGAASQSSSDEFAARLLQVREQWKLVYIQMEELELFLSALEQTSRETGEFTRIRSHESITVLPQMFDLTRSRKIETDD